MKNFRDSDYALNKYSEGIVYRFADKIMTVTLADYLAENPDKTEADFQDLKELSDGIYLSQVRNENAKTKKNVSFYGMEDCTDFHGFTPDEEYINAQEKQAASEAFEALLADEKLTETQERRFRMHVLEGMSLRAIAEQENVALRAVQQSVDAATDKLKKYFNFF